MSKYKENLQKYNALIFVTVAVVVCIVAFFAISYMFSINSKKATGVVCFSTNPSVTMTLNSNNRIVEVIYDNKDAETLLSSIDMSGKTLKQASRIFVERCCESGFLDASQTSNGQSVQVYVANLNEKKIGKLKTIIIDEMNSYFDEKGIIAGAVSTQMDELKDLAVQHSMTVNKLLMLQAMEKIDHNLNIDDFVGYDEKELMQMLSDMSSNLKGLSFDYVDEYNEVLHTNLENLRNDLDVILQPVFEIAEFDFKITLKTSVKDLLDQIKESEVDEILKVQLTEALKELKKDINDKVNFYSKKVDKQKENLLKDSEQSFDDAKSLLKKKITSYENTFNEGRTYFEQNKAEINEKIKLYRENLELNSSIEPLMF